MLNVRLLRTPKELVLGLSLTRYLGLKQRGLTVTNGTATVSSASCQLKTYNLVTQSTNWPSLDCGCTEGPSSKDWWEVPELSISLSNIVALQEDIFVRGRKTKPKTKSKTNKIKIVSLPQCLRRTQGSCCCSSCWPSHSSAPPRRRYHPWSLRPRTKAAWSWRPAPTRSCWETREGSGEGPQILGAL